MLVIPLYQLYCSSCVVVCLYLLTELTPRTERIQMVRISTEPENRDSCESSAVGQKVVCVLTHWSSLGRICYKLLKAESEL